VIDLPKTLNDYVRLEERLKHEDPDVAAHVMREMGRSDLYYLLRYILSTRDWCDPEDMDDAGKPNPGARNFWDHPWLLARCREVQFDSENTLNIWSRYHAKTTIVTFAFSILTMIQNPNVTIGIFSVTKKVAEAFLGQVKNELEGNELLQNLYPERFYKEPRKEAQLWTVEKGFTIKRPLNLKDSTMNSFGLIDTAFTGHRISHFIYDDAVNESNVNTPDQVQKTNERWELSLNVGMPGCRRYYVGTFYAYGDTYHHMAERGVKLRLNPCYALDYEKSVFETKTGLPTTLVHKRDQPVLFSQEHLDKEEQLQGQTSFGVQMLCDPNAGAMAGFKPEYLRYYTGSTTNIVRHSNIIITVDPASDKKKGSSKTAMVVWALGRDKNYFVVDMVVDRLNLHQRTEILFELVAQWEPQQVRYEKYSMQSDIEHIQYVQNQRGFYFHIEKVGGSLSKDDRIARLIPLFATGRIYLPQRLQYLNAEGEIVDLIQDFIKEEYSHFPNTMQKDCLDSMSRICEMDLPLPWPKPRHYGKNDDMWRKALRAKDSKEEGTWESQ